jgi:site-specific DNA recombinase
MKAVGYCRASAESQNALGLEAQREAIRRYCQVNGLELVEIYEDPALSGSLKPLERPGLLALMETMKSGVIPRVIVSRLDRISQDTMLCLWLEMEIRKHGAELVSVSEPYRWNDTLSYAANGPSPSSSFL